jgi:hypothetical protein
VIAGLAATGKAGAAKVLVAAAVAGGTVGAGVAEVKHLNSDSNQPAAPAQRHHGQGATHKTPNAVSGTTGKHLAKGKNGTATGHHNAGTHGKPGSSPAASSHAATGKGISGTQHQSHGKAGAPGQQKTKTNNAGAHTQGKREHVTKTPPASAHTTPSSPARPTTPPGQTKQQPQQVVPTQTQPATPPVTTVTDEVTGSTHGNAKQ